MSIPVMVTLGASAGAFFSVMKDAEASMLGMADSAKITEASMDRLSTKLSVGIVGAVGVFAAEGVKMAVDFNTAMEHLVTAADLPQGAVKELGNQFIELSTKVATSATDLANASYYVLSEGYNWKSVSGIMHTAAELSKEDQTDLVSATRALITTMHDYGADASQSTQYGNAFRQMLAESGTNMQSLSENMGRVDQIAHALGITFPQVAGALATLTREGMDGAQAETLLSTAMGHLAGDTPKMSKELQGLGINVAQFQQALASPSGLVGAITEVQNAIVSHLGPDGLVYLQGQLKASKGNIDEFATAMGKAPPKIQSYVAALGDAMGGTRNLGVILGLSGANLQDFTNNVNGVANAFKQGGPDITNWSTYTDTAKFKMDQLKTSAGDMALHLGNELLPALNHVVGGLNDFFGYLDRNKTAADAFNIALGVLALGGIANLALKIGGLIGNLGTLVVSLYSGVTAMGSFVVMVGGALYGALSTATVAVGRFAFAWAIIGWDAITTGLASIGTALTTTVVPGLISATSASWAFTASLLANPITWFVALIVFGIAYVIFWIWAFATNWHGVTALVAGYMADIVTAFVDGWTAVVGFLHSAESEISSSLESLWVNIVSGVVNFGSTLYSAFIAPFFQMISAALGFVGQMQSAGYQLMMGLVSGIESAAQAVVNAVSSAVSNAYHAALSFLGISSPSRLFHEGVGMPIGQGIAAGIAGTAGLISRQVNAAVDPANMGLRSSIGSGGFGLAAAGQGGQNVTFNVELHGNIYGSNLSGAAQELWKQFLQIQRTQGSLGFVS